MTTKSNSKLYQEEKEGSTERSFVSNVFDSVFSMFSSDDKKQEERMKGSKPHMTRNTTSSKHFEKFDEDLLKPYHEAIDLKAK